jgi:hypothetical protein
MRSVGLLVLFLATSCTPSSSSTLDSRLENSPKTPVVGVAQLPEYDRSSWGRWKDADKDCQDTRQEVLIAESLEPVVLDERGCKVLAGRWRCPYTGNEYSLPTALDIDHVVAVAEAHEFGGHSWDKAKKSAYFNDLSNPNHLIAVDRSANRSKGARGPEDWLPTNAAYRCEYLKNRAEILATYGLKYDCGLYLSLVAAHCRSGTMAP